MARKATGGMGSLESLRHAFGGDAAEEKLELLERLEETSLPTASQVAGLHDLLCFWRAYPDNAVVLSAVERMLEAQGGVCAICRKPRPENRTLHVDHDHKTGRIRGLLCFRCNNALGDFEEQWELFQLAADYLERDEVLTAKVRERVVALGG